MIIYFDTYRFMQVGLKILKINWNYVSRYMQVKLKALKTNWNYVFQFELD